MNRLVSDLSSVLCSFFVLQGHHGPHLIYWKFEKFEIFTFVHDDSSFSEYRHDANLALFSEYGVSYFDWIDLWLFRFKNWIQNQNHQMYWYWCFLSSSHSVSSLIVQLSCLYCCHSCFWFDRSVLLNKDSSSQDWSSHLKILARSVRHRSTIISSSGTFRGLHRSYCWNSSNYNLSGFYLRLWSFLGSKCWLYCLGHSYYANSWTIGRCRQCLGRCCPPWTDPWGRTHLWCSWCPCLHPCSPTPAFACYWICFQHIASAAIISAAWRANPDPACSYWPADVHLHLWQSVWYVYFRTAVKFHLLLYYGLSWYCSSYFGRFNLHVCFSIQSCRRNQTAANYLQNLHPKIHWSGVHPEIIWSSWFPRVPLPYFYLFAFNSFHFKLSKCSFLSSYLSVQDREKDPPWPRFWPNFRYCIQRFVNCWFHENYRYKNSCHYHGWNHFVLWNQSFGHFEYFQIFQLRGRLHSWWGPRSPLAHFGHWDTSQCSPVKCYSLASEETASAALIWTSFSSRPITYWCFGSNYCSYSDHEEVYLRNLNKYVNE